MYESGDPGAGLPRDESSSGASMSRMSVEPTDGALRRALLLLADHNPLLMLSGVCMLAGCYLISSAVHGQESPLWPLVSLLVTFNIYEVTVVALGLYLARDRGLLRDGGVLLMLEAMLLVDVTFLYNELVTAHFLWGATIAGFGCVLAMMKVGVIDHVLRLGLTPRGWGVVASGLVLIMGLPVALRGLAYDGYLPDWALYGGWWLLGLWLMWFALFPGAGAGMFVDGGMGSSARLRRWLRGALIGLPGVSVAAHLLGAHWVYGCTAWWADLAPLMLAGAAVLLRRGPAHASGAVMAPMVFGCLALTVLMSVHFDDGLSGAVWPDGVMFSPLRLTTLASAALGLWGWWRLGAWSLLGEAVAMITLAFLGHTPAAIRISLAQMRGSSGQWVKDHFPHTTLQWGVTAVAAAFVLLGLGAWVSLMKRPRGDGGVSAHDPGPSKTQGRA